MLATPYGFTLNIRMPGELPPNQNKDLMSFYLTTSGLLAGLTRSSDLEIDTASTLKNEADDEFMDKMSKEASLNLIKRNTVLNVSSRRREYLQYKAAVLWASASLPKEK